MQVNLQAENKITYIRPTQKWQLIDIKELLRFKELFYIFVWRDLKVRYKQTVIGIMWVLFQPLAATLIFTIFFGKVAKIPSDDLPYQLFAAIGLVYWTFYSSALGHASNSFIENVEIVKKIYFPREILTISAILTSLVDFLIAFLVLSLVTIFFGFWPKITIFWLTPIAVLLTISSAAGLGLFLASVNIKYRDVRYILPFFLQMLLFITPVIYPLSSVDAKLRPLLALNPMTSVVEIARSVYSNNFLDPWVLSISIISCLITLFVGLAYFKNTERLIADLV